VNATPESEGNRELIALYDTTLEHLTIPYQTQWFVIVCKAEGNIMNELPEKIKNRIELSGIFYPLDQNQKTKWGRIMSKGFDAVLEKLGTLAEDLGYNQETISGNTILWADKNAPGVECMICWVDEVMDLNQMQGVFRQIRKYKPVFTYAIVHQKKDGEGNYDIFRFSRFSYLEHCNRVRAPKLRK
jgi:hypothetical protein